MYTGFRVPVIKVKDNQSTANEPRVIGFDSHDTLYIDPETNGLQYLNLQCCEGTKFNTFSFVGTKPDEYEPYSYIEWWTLDKCIEYAKEQDAKHKENERKLRELLQADTMFM